MDLPLDTMSTAEKLLAIEQIWADLLQTPDDVPSPAWHRDVLEARERRVRDGQSSFSDGDEVKAGPSSQKVL